MTDISEVARRSGVPASTLRFYEKRGLLAAIRSAGGRRHFEANVFDRLGLIALGRAGGLSLDDIGEIMLPAGGLSVDRRRLTAQADEIDENIRRLQAMSKGLRHVASCTAPSHAQCPIFRRLVKIAAAGRLGKGRPSRRRVQKT